ncbi:MAG: hypothetical protein DRI90_26185 [Deltaproteobacteria bacterium]|nr:MAG: hypothetical protein DRI90_26185 [Deltaproteobacteria bacterium]
MMNRLFRRARTLGVLSATVLTATLAQAQQAPPPTTTDTAASPTEPTQTPVAPATVEPGPDWQLLGGIGGLIVGASFAVMGLYSFVRVNDIGDDGDFIAYQSRIPSDRDACDAAHAGEQVSTTGQPDPGHVADLCDEADTLQVMQGISLPATLLAGVVGAVLVGTSDTWCGTGDSALRIDPWLGPKGGGLGLSARF